MDGLISHNAFVRSMQSYYMKRYPSLSGHFERRLFRLDDNQNSIPRVFVNRYLDLIDRIKLWTIRQQRECMMTMAPKGPQGCGGSLRWPLYVCLVSELHCLRCNKSRDRFQDLRIYTGHYSSFCCVSQLLWCRHTTNES